MLQNPAEMRIFPPSPPAPLHAQSVVCPLGVIGPIVLYLYHHHSTRRSPDVW